MPLIGAVHLGTIEYRAAWEMQRRLVRARQEGATGNLLLMLQHPPVITIGRRAGEEHLLIPEAELNKRGISVERVDRGGLITYHGPGQLVVYPILDLHEWKTSVRLYIRSLEEVLIRVCQELGIQAGRLESLTGVWVGDEKVAAIGVRLSRWVTSHGFALNVSCDLTPFSYIIPCGIQGKGATSLDGLIKRGVRAHGRAPLQTIDAEDIIPLVLRHFAQVFDAEIVERAEEDSL